MDDLLQTDHQPLPQSSGGAFKLFDGGVSRTDKALCSWPTRAHGAGQFGQRTALASEVYQHSCLHADIGISHRATISR
ncbi:hypothetical protein C3R74_03640 [Acidithiobacillus ferridurans]|nr:hypothetical protein C3R74_03640 [Acidithiobacillus ferridurans]